MMSFWVVRKRIKLEEVLHQDVYSMGKWDRSNIIIPKETPKQNLEKDMFELELDIPSHLRFHNSKQEA
jgi:hypothetical protein